jgi:hypothetical protein
MHAEFPWMFILVSYLQDCKGLKSYIEVIRFDCKLRLVRLGYFVREEMDVPGILGGCKFTY